NTPRTTWAFLGGLEWKLKFRAPVRAADILRARVTVKDKRLWIKPGRGMVTLLNEILNQRSEVVGIVEVTALLATRVEGAVPGAGDSADHPHAWSPPPLGPMTGDDFCCHPYLTEYPERVMKEKIRILTRLLEDRFDQEVISHRAGRWAFDSRYAAMLLDEGYRVDCSVTPGVDWRGNPGNPGGNGG